MKEFLKLIDKREDQARKVIHSQEELSIRVLRSSGSKWIARLIWLLVMAYLVYGLRPSLGTATTLILALILTPLFALFFYRFGYKIQQVILGLNIYFYKDFVLINREGSEKTREFYYKLKHKDLKEAQVLVWKGQKYLSLKGDMETLYYDPKDKFKKPRGYSKNQEESLALGLKNPSGLDLLEIFRENTPYKIKKKTKKAR